MHTTITTSQWTINLTLYPDHAPMTVTNFVVLSQQWFYDGLTFHRVIEEFMIQWWCPVGNWTGWPGYSFHDEFHAELRHNWPWILSMANSWPNSNGSQFFITHTETARLDDKHTIFGSVVSQQDQDIVNSIKQNDIIKTITINDDPTSLLTDMDEFVQSILWALKKQ